MGDVFPELNRVAQLYTQLNEDETNFKNAYAVAERTKQKNYSYYDITRRLKPLNEAILLADPAMAPREILNHVFDARQGLRDALIKLRDELAEEIQKALLCLNGSEKKLNKIDEIIQAHYDMVKTITAPYDLSIYQNKTHEANIMYQSMIRERHAAVKRCYEESIKTPWTASKIGKTIAKVAAAVVAVCFATVLGAVVGALLGGPAGAVMGLAAGIWTTGAILGAIGGGVIASECAAGLFLTPRGRDKHLSHVKTAANTLVKDSMKAEQAYKLI